MWAARGTPLPQPPAAQAQPRVLPLSPPCRWGQRQQQVLPAAAAGRGQLRLAQQAVAEALLQQVPELRWAQPALVPCCWGCLVQQAQQQQGWGRLPCCGPALPQ